MKYKIRVTTKDLARFIRARASKTEVPPGDYLISIQSDYQGFYIRLIDKDETREPILL